MKKRRLEVVVISDVHLGTPNCHAEELMAYLSSIEPKKLVLNGDILDVGQFNNHFFPASHLKILKKIISMASKGTEVIYITGNQDEKLRKFSYTRMGNLSIQDNLVLNMDGRKAWIFHGDVFDISIPQSKRLAKMGDTGFQILLHSNRVLNWFFTKLGKEKYSLSGKIKSNAKNAEKYSNLFKKNAVETALYRGYDYVICGHIHQPEKETFEKKNRKCTYLNSGDWVENLTALEYSFKRWKIYNYSYDKLSPFFADEDLKSMELSDLINSLETKQEFRQKQKQGEDESIDA
ncbi:UDP-2,3-diacylglucosamine diphosphatase [Eudoraea adriatica]|mgnify:FL=1|uniref:UDP-2,3-diacylglucosamine diphosphatase n=1 Tax=Eudoraea adriatica TaxID=446681 RepID=UPI000475862F|nr:UDP-2,3-diacylglucosamine diphosphatase [Eudoraea adriatica]